MEKEICGKCGGIIETVPPTFYWGYGDPPEYFPGYLPPCPRCGARKEGERWFSIIEDWREGRRAWAAAEEREGIEDNIVD